MGAAWVLLIGVAMSGAYTGSRSAVAQDFPSLADEANALLGLAASTVVALELEANVAATRTIAVPLDGESYTLDLAPFSVRSDAYEVLAQLADGSYVEIAPGPVRTLRGTVAGLEGSAVAASLTDDGIRARIMFPSGVTYWIEPIGTRIAGAAAGQHVVYRDDDVIPSGGTCIARHPPGGAAASSEQSGGVAAVGLFIAELAVDADYEYFLQFSGAANPVAAVEQDINDTINAMNVQYEQDVAIQHFITRIIIRTTEESDPYTTSDPIELLNQFGAQWIAEHGDIQRDAAQLFTGKNLSGNTIGIAWVGSICSPFLGYSVVQSNCLGCSNFACKTALSTHELGHNWGADHCNGRNCDPDVCREYTMHCSLRCVDQFHPTLTIPEINRHRDSRTCLDVGDELRRIIVLSEATTVAERGTLHFNAIADFRFGDDLNITSEAIWSVDRAEVGSIDSDGLFTAFNVDGDACVTISASWELDGTLHTGERTILVLDMDAPLALQESIPPDGAVDARQPSRPDRTFPVGWESFELTFTGDVCLITGASDFAVTTEGGVSDPPPIASFERVPPRSVRILLQTPIEPGAWTTVMHIDSGAGTRVGYLPGDVTGNGRAGPDDIAALIGALNGVGGPWPIHSTDIDRSGRFAPHDLLRVVDVLNGAVMYERWNGRTLP
jgi:hypothetical protein